MTGTAAPVAVVTGASRGIGKQLCLDLAGAGYDVVCAARSTQEAPSKLPGTIEETAEGVRARGRRALAAPLDVRDEAAVQALAERVLAEWGRCDLLVNNAAVAPPRPALEDSVRHWLLAVDVNLNGPFYLTYHFARRMTPGASRVINVSSFAALFPSFGRPSYTATKAALESLSQALAHELRGRVAVDTVRIDLPLWTEGYAETLPDDAAIRFEDPVVMSDAVLWLAPQPVAETGRVLSLQELRQKGIVRPRTPHGV